MRNRSVTYSTEAAFHALADPTRRALLDLFGKAASQPDRSRRLFQFRGPPFQSICDYCGAPTWFERGVGDGIAFTISIPSL